MRAFLTWISLAITLTAIIFSGWVSDDAFFTFRTLDNLVNGHGLSYNTDLRVQAYTHPLWLFLHLPVYLFWRDAFNVSILVSVTVSFLSLAVLATRFRDLPDVFLCCLIIPFLCSIAMLDFSTSGLENPLTFLLLSLFAVAFFDGQGVAWSRLSAIAGLAALNRLDALLFFLPCLALIILKHGFRIHWRAAMPGPIMIAAWTSFSLFYYGMPFPNTSYAKLGGGAKLEHHLLQGWFYIVDLFTYRLSTALMLVLGLCLLAYHAKAAVQWLVRRAPGSEGEFSFRVVAFGSGFLCYALYVVWIGGDFMSGRHWTGPWMVCSIVACYHAASVPSAKRWVVWLLPLVFVSAAVARERHASSTPQEYCITDEAANCRPTSSFIGNLLHGDFENFPTRQWLTQDPAAFAKPRVIVFVNPAILSYFAGPQIVFIDTLALADPLLARLPKVEAAFCIGHSPRHLPAGYEHARGTGDTSRMNESIRQYWDVIHLITAGPLFSWERLKAIVAFNLGRYDHLRDAYLESGEYPLVDHGHSLRDS